MTVGSVYIELDFKLGGKGESQFAGQHLEFKGEHLLRTADGQLIPAFALPINYQYENRDTDLKEI
ncbi:MAG: hypothetical protein ACRC5V_01440 [Aeromonas sp.]